MFVIEGWTVYSFLRIFKIACVPSVLVIQFMNNIYKEEGKYEYAVYLHPKYEKCQETYFRKQTYMYVKDNESITILLVNLRCPSYCLSLYIKTYSVNKWNILDHLINSCGHFDTWIGLYLTCIKFRLYKVSRFREFGLQFAKLNPRECFKYEVDSRNFKSTF